MRERFILDPDSGPVGKRKLVRVANNVHERNAEEALAHGVEGFNKGRSESDGQIISAQALDPARFSHALGEMRKANGGTHRVSGAEFREAMRSPAMRKSLGYEL